MINLLKQNGFKEAGRCSCGGTLTLKFTKGFYLIKWQKKKQKFKAYDKGKIIQPLTDETNIIKFLQTILPQA